jgi:hypothetical protein
VGSLGVHRGDPPLRGVNLRHRARVEAFGLEDQRAHLAPVIPEAHEEVRQIFPALASVRVRDREAEVEVLHEREHMRVGIQVERR